jgi:hypothetical protein
MIDYIINGAMLMVGLVFFYVIILIFLNAVEAMDRGDDYE